MSKENVTFHQLLLSCFKRNPDMRSSSSEVLDKFEEYLLEITEADLLNAGLFWGKHSTGSTDSKM